MKMNIMCKIDTDSDHGNHWLYYKGIQIGALNTIQFNYFAEQPVEKKKETESFKKLGEIKAMADVSGFTISDIVKLKIAGII